MTYYEEFGVSPSASPEEIREAYRQLAKLLHPDTVQNDRQRAVAECQMRRLNDVYQTLLDPDRRWMYDRGLSHPEDLVVPAHPLVALASHWKLDPVSIWPVTGLLALLLAFFLSWAAAASDRERAAQQQMQAKARQDAAAACRDAPQRPEEPGTKSERQPVKQREQLLRRELAALARDRDRVLSKLAAAENDLRLLQARLLIVHKPLAASTQPIAQVPGTVAHTVGTAQEKLRATAPAVNRDSPLAGVWYYARAGTQQVDREMYPPEFIEAVIVDESGMMHGRYRARYRVADGAISPDVSFSFSGRSADAAARFPWLGAAGARGEVRFRLLTPNSLEVAWMASELGASLGLGSGRAVLQRRQER